MSHQWAEARARRALAEAGLDYAMPLTRASSVTNEVWLGAEYVIRVNRRPNQRLRREAYLGPLLPPEVHYPEIIAYGGELGADWLIVRRLPGEVLSRRWPTMSTGERRSATRQFAVLLRNLHAVAAPQDLPEIDAAPQLLAAREYGFFANVNPAVDHPRWSQATERRIGEFRRRDTLPFNGYGEWVGDLYRGMDLKKNY